MLKFFRVYNKWILVIGGSLLMIAFLIQPVMDIFVPSPGSMPIGEINGEPVTGAERQAAATELMVLGNLPVLNRFTPEDPIHWLLMTREAATFGLSASQAEVESVLQTVGVDETNLARLAQQTRLPAEFIRQAVLNWIVVQQYQSLMMGEAYIPLIDKVRTFAQAQMMIEQGDIFAAVRYINAVTGSQRLSQPLIEHFVANQRATVAGEAVTVPAEFVLDEVGQPSEETLQELFEAHRDDLRGQSEPYGFGYRRPARITLEWLTIPFADVIAQVQVDEAEALAYYERNQASFSRNGEVPPYTQVRRQVREMLQQQEAERLARRIADQARSLLLDHESVRRLPAEAGYRDIPENFEPLPLQAVADAIRERFEVSAQVTSEPRTVPLRELSSVPGIGSATLAERPEISAGAYIASARELEPAPDHPLVPLRLQAGLPGQTLRGPSGNYFVFRLRDAAPDRVPESLDEVRDEVVQDARRLAAYQQLLAQRDQYVEIARDAGLGQLADQVGQPGINIPALPRRTFNEQGQLAAPTLPGIGNSGPLLDAMFQLARDVSDETPLADVPEAQRIGATGIDHRLQLAVFRVDRFQPITRTALDQMAQMPDLGAIINQLLLADRVDENPLSIERIAQRIGYTGDGLDDADD